MDFVSSMLPLLGGAGGLAALFFIWKKSSAVRAGWPESRRKAFERALLGAAIVLSCVMLYTFREMAYGLGGMLIFALGVAIPALLSRRAGEQADRSEPGVLAEVPAPELARLIRKVRVPTLIELGPVPVPVSAEPQHLAVLDATPAGRLAALSAILGRIRSRGDTAFVLDANGELLSRHFDAGSDFLFNPEDARSVEALNGPGSEDAFSVAAMVQAEHSGVLFLPYHDSQGESLRGALTQLFEEAGRAVLELEADARRRVWFIVDDVRSLERLPVLDALLTRARAKGACVVLGLPSLDALEEVYGAQGARNLLGSVESWLVMRCADEPSAQYASERLDELARADALPQAQLAAARLAALPPLQGLLRLPGGYPLAQVTLTEPGAALQVPFQVRDPEAARVRAEARAAEKAARAARQAAEAAAAAAAAAQKPAATSLLRSRPVQDIPVPTPVAAAPAASRAPAVAPDAPLEVVTEVASPAEAPAPRAAQVAAQPAPVRPATAPPRTEPVRAERTPVRAPERPQAGTSESTRSSDPAAVVARLVRAAQGRSSLLERLQAQEPAPGASNATPPVSASKSAPAAEVPSGARAEPPAQRRTQPSGSSEPMRQPSQRAPSVPTEAPRKPAARPNPMLDGLLRATPATARRASEEAQAPATSQASEHVTPPASSVVSPSSVPDAPVTPVVSEAAPLERASVDSAVSGDTAHPDERSVSAQARAPKGAGSGGPRRDNRSDSRSSRPASRPSARPSEPGAGKARDLLQGLLK